MAFLVCLLENAPDVAIGKVLRRFCRVFGIPVATEQTLGLCSWMDRDARLAHIRLPHGITNRSHAYSGKIKVSQVSQALSMHIVSNDNPTVVNNTEATWSGRMCAEGGGGT